MTCKRCGHKLGRVIGCGTFGRCADSESRHYHCLSIGCVDDCSVTGTCVPVYDVEQEVLNTVKVITA